MNTDFLSPVEGVVLAHTYVDTVVKTGAALAHDDIAREDRLAAVDLDAEAFAFGIAAVAGTTACFLVSHLLSP